MINVLMLGPSRKVHGGISAVVNNLFDAGLDKQVNLRYLATMEEGNKLHKLMVAIKAYLAFSKQLEWADVVHVNMASDSSYKRKSLFILKAHKAGKRIIIHQHGGNFEHYFQNILNDSQKDKAKKILNLADMLIILSPIDEPFFESIVGESKIQILPNSVKIPSDSAKRDKDYSSQKALFLGRICKSKGISELLDACDIIHRNFPEFTLYLGGIFEDSFYEEEVTKRSKYVKYLGWIASDEKEKYLRECNIFVLPTYFEGQPVSVLEAMAHSCVVVASNVGGIPMMIQNDVNGILIEAQDIDSLISGLVSALSDSDRSKRLGQKAFQTVSSTYSIEKTVEDLVTIYKKVLEND